MSCVRSNPFHTERDPSIQWSYLRWAYNEYTRIAGRPDTPPYTYRYWSARYGYGTSVTDPPHRPRQSVLSELYFELRLVGYIWMGFEEFRSRILSGSIYKPRWVPGDRYPHGKGFRRRQKYQGGGEPKELTEDELYRRETGLYRDKARRNRRTRPRKKWAKKFSNRGFRHYEKRLLQVGKEIELFSVKRKDWFDPWDWD